jgi:hypothetical protein
MSVPTNDDDAKRSLTENPHGIPGTSSESDDGTAGRY